MNEMVTWCGPPDLETKFCRLGEGLSLGDGVVIEGYASLFGLPDSGGDVVEKGAYRAGLEAMAREGRAVRMLWQHDAREPIGVWEEVREDERGLYVRGRLLEAVQRGREAKALIEAGAVDGLSIGYRVLRAEKDEKGLRRLRQIELWEVSLVTFPMQPLARLGSQRVARPAELAKAAGDASAARAEAGEAGEEIVGAFLDAIAEARAMLGSRMWQAEARLGELSCGEVIAAGRMKGVLT